MGKDLISLTIVFVLQIIIGLPFKYAVYRVGEQLADEEEIGTDFDSFYSDESKELADAEKPTDEVLADAKAKIIEYVVKSLKGEEAAAPEYGDAAYAHAFEHAAERLYSQYVTTGRDGVAKDGVTYADPEGESTSDLDKWLFAKDRKGSSPVTAVFSLFFISFVRRCRLSSDPVCR